MEKDIISLERTKWEMSVLCGIGAEIIEAETCPSYIHMLLSIPPKSV